MIIQRSTAVFSLILGGFLVVGSAKAESGPDWSRPGAYVGIGAGAAFDFVEDVVEDAFPAVDIKHTWSLNARVGYRVTSWFAVEAMYEGAYDFSTEIDLIDLDTRLDLHSLLANFKFIAPFPRLQPYLMLGFGAQYGKFDSGPIGNPPIPAIKVGLWDFVFRPAVGLDTYITENWVFVVELAPSIRVTRWDNIPSEFTDNITLTVGGGLQYRF